MKKELIITTRNKGKFAEIMAALKDLPFEFFTIDDRNESPQDSYGRFLPVRSIIFLTLPWHS